MGKTPFDDLDVDLAAAAIKAALNKDEKKRADELERESHERTHGKLLGKCRVCLEGEVVRKSSRRFRGDSRHIPIGPASQQYLVETSDIFCKSCGVKYQFWPAEIKEV